MSFAGDAGATVEVTIISLVAVVVVVVVVVVARVVVVVVDNSCRPIPPRSSSGQQVKPEIIDSMVPGGGVEPP